MPTSLVKFFFYILYSLSFTDGTHMAWTFCHYRPFNPERWWLSSLILYSGEEVAFEVPERWIGNMGQTSQHYNSKREFPLPSVASIPYQPINVDYLEEEFSGHGVTFEGIGDNCVAKMGLENGSTVNLMLPSGLISSYKAPMWHGGKVELLHTSVSEDENGGAVIQGGVSLALNCSSDGDDEVSWSPCNWALRNIRGDAQESIQVELIDRDSENKIEVKYIVTLKKDMLSSELVVSNSKSSSLLQLTGSIVSHLVVSTPDATYALGLEGSDFFNRSPLLTNFALVPPDFGQKNEFGLGQFLGQMTLKGLSSGWGARNQNTADDAESSPRESEEEMDGEEDDSYKHLKEQMSRIYTSAPRYFTIIDRGKRNSVGVGREGFDELYMFSPGSRHEYYSTYSYVCVGQSALLKPIILGPEEEWRGLQHLHNPNL